LIHFYKRLKINLPILLFKKRSEKLDVSW